MYDLWGTRTHSPLEQFSILLLIAMNIGNLYFLFTNPYLFMLLTLNLVLLLVHFVIKNGGNPVNEQIDGLSENVKQKFIYIPMYIATFIFTIISYNFYP